MGVCKHFLVGLSKYRGYKPLRLYSGGLIVGTIFELFGGIIFEILRYDEMLHQFSHMGISIFLSQSPPGQHVTVWDSKLAHCTGRVIPYRNYSTSTNFSLLRDVITFSQTDQMNQ